MKNCWKKLCGLMLAVAMVFAVATTALAADPWDPQTANINWRQFEGQELRLFMVQHMTTNAVSKYLDEFTELTGIKVNLEVLPESDYNSKLLIEFNSGSNPIDIFQLTSGQNLSTGGWLVDLWPYINDPTLTDPEFYNMDDFLPSAIKYAHWEDKILFGIPFSAEWQIMYYRKDLLEAAGIPVPKTLDELKEACAKLNNPEENVYGIVARLKKGTGADCEYNNMLKAFGGDFFKRIDGKMQCMFYEQAAIDAAEYYSGLLRDYGAPGQINYGWTEAVAEFAAGHAAFFIDGTGFLGQILNPEVSAVVGKVGYAPVPAGPAGDDYGLHFAHWCYAIGPQSENKGASWLFIQWVTSTDMVNKCGLEMGASTRYSLLNSKEYNEKFGDEFAAAALDGAKRGERLFGNWFPCWAACRDYIVGGLQEIYEGADAAVVMPRVAEEVTEVYKDQ